MDPEIKEKKRSLLLCCYFHTWETLPWEAIQQKLPFKLFNAVFLSKIERGGGEGVGGRERNIDIFKYMQEVWEMLSWQGRLVTYLSIIF